MVVSVHPRVRGDMLYVAQNTHSIYGSPPRARGHGLTQIRTEDAIPVHPRVRGDMVVAIPQENGNIGSPPRARGHAVGADADEQPVRFTPACAGTWLSGQAL